MAYRVEYSATARRQLRKLHRPVAARIVAYLDEVKAFDEPRDRGKGLVGNRAGIWRYRIGDYRVLCELLDGEMVILALAVAHRREVYDE